MPPIHHVTNNAMARAMVSYIIMDDLSQTPTVMSTLEVLKTCPTQQKSLLATLGAVDPSDSKLITFDKREWRTIDAISHCPSNPGVYPKLGCAPVHSR